MKLSKLAYSILAGILMLSIAPVFGELSKSDSPASEPTSSCKASSFH